MIELGARIDALLTSQPSALADPYPIYREIRESARVYRHNTMAFLSYYDDVKFAIGDTRHFSNHASRGGSRAKEIRAKLLPEHQAIFDALATFEAHSMARADGEQHTRLRRIAHRAFTPRSIAKLDHQIDRYTRHLMSEMTETDIVDFMDLSYRLPLWVVCDLLGVPARDREHIHSLSTRIARNRGGGELEPLLDAYDAHLELRGYVDEVVSAYKRSPASASDLVAALLDAESDERLSADELTAMFVVLLVAGHETTTILLSTGLLELLSQPAQWQKLAAEPERTSDAVEELLRYVSPAQWLPRFALEPVSFEGETVEAGTTVVPLLPIANRDPQVFPDPDRLDIARRPSAKHLALGYGPHFCIGAALARREGEIVLRLLAGTFPRIQLAEDHFEWTGNIVLRRLAKLPVSLGPVSSDALTLTVI